MVHDGKAAVNLNQQAAKIFKVEAVRDITDPRGA